MIFFAISKGFFWKNIIFSTFSYFLYFPQIETQQIKKIYTTFALLIVFLIFLSSFHVTAENHDWIKCCRNWLDLEIKRYSYKNETESVKFVILNKIF